MKVENMNYQTLNLTHGFAAEKKIPVLVLAVFVLVECALHNVYFRLGWPNLRVLITLILCQIDAAWPSFMPLSVGLLSSFLIAAIFNLR